MRNYLHHIMTGLFLLVQCLTTAQDTVLTRECLPQYDSLKVLYPFLLTAKNHLTEDTASLRPFYQKLMRIEQGSGERGVVVHIGDSHVQPGVFTQPLREWLQSTFGNGGKGMMFPYRLAKSNGPSGYISHCDTPWIYGRNATLKRPLPTGISGFTLWSANPNASFTIEFTSPPALSSDTSRLILFHASKDTCFSFCVTNELTGQDYPVLDTSSDTQTIYLLDDQPLKIRIRAIRTRSSQLSATFYGMSLESVSPGVVVHTIGVNGAMFSSYLESEHFVEQLAKLKPDLMIFSLGTNEAFGTKGYSSDTLKGNLDSLFTRIRRSGNQAPVILTTPPGIYKSYRKKRRTNYKPNPLAQNVSEILMNYTHNHGMAVWDWYTVMGGKDGMAKWKAKKLTDRRYIHFSGKGYGIQGVMMREAIREGYIHFKL